MTKWRKNKTFIKSPRKKLEIKKIKTDNKIPKTKKINMCFVGEESENKGGNSHWRQTTHHLSTHATLEEIGSDNPSNNTIEVDI
jgi:hypothetical protein